MQIWFESNLIQNITHIIRGEDLFHTSHIHRLLQAIFELPTPEYIHHDLIRDTNGVRFAKRHKSETLQSLRHNGTSAQEVYARLGISPH